MTAAEPPVPSAGRTEPFEVRARPVRADAVVLEARGAVDLATAGALEHAAAEQLAQGRTRILLDLAGVPLCDSTGLTALLRIHHRAEADGGRLRLVAPRQQVRGLLELTNLTRVLDVRDSADDALAD